MIEHCGALPRRGLNMSYIDEICGYLLQRGYVTRKEISTLIKEFGESPELLDENDGEVEECLEQEEETYPFHEESFEGEGKPRSGKGGGGGCRTSGGKKVKITASELDVKIPTLDWGLKLMQFLYIKSLYQKRKLI